MHNNFNSIGRASDVNEIPKSPHNSLALNLKYLGMVWPNYGNYCFYKENYKNHVPRPNYGRPPRIHPKGALRADVAEECFAQFYR